MFSKKVLWIVVGMAAIVLNGALYAAPGGRDFGRGRDPGRGRDFGRDRGSDHFRVVIFPPRIRPLIICPPRHIWVEPSIIIAAPPIVVAPSRTVVVTEASAVTVPAPQETTVVWITNDNGSKTAVKLVKQQDLPGYYVGPKGEYYPVLPTDEQLRPLYGLRSVSAGQVNITVWLTNDNSSKTPVTLTPSNGGFVGPSGEFYATMPSEQQLKAVYGMPVQNTQKDSISTVVWINVADKKVPIVLIKEGNEFVGPSGEHYSAIPSKEQLEAVYGKTAAPAANANSITIWIESDGSKIPVTLQKQGTNYIGPNGEQYTALPTADQLKPIYAPTDGDEFGVQITKNDGTQTVITLKRKGTRFIGPNGENYPAMPTEEQLKAAYGK